MRYEIIVKGYLKSVSGERFCEMDSENLENAMTRLSGEIVDQSALFGILRTINNLGIELISVNRQS
ncbi:MULTISPECIES: hypothetical protein [unclassified Fusibacter]|uniref:hypothetical protein n=1 Tax=unclassified Fusibacter TaxID=2624464 RepID=UPI001011DF6A|nr:MULTISPECIES: hypothetical protein [unclassified Fusibacter]MCK8060920.1 hypothetical protein [Fusibacter sp. A2]NPE23216.1 hypothetical protein [Fusibacter sp. A1]RXV59572.1 hypothetical protein DWB64_15400 [Fusibacter sp. A1]